MTDTSNSLLSEDELFTQIATNLAFDEGWDDTQARFVRRKDIKSIVNLIQSQKLAYLESRIGDEVVVNEAYWDGVNSEKRRLRKIVEVERKRSNV